MSDDDDQHVVRARVRLRAYALYPPDVMIIYYTDLFGATSGMAGAAAVKVSAGVMRPARFGPTSSSSFDFTCVIPGRLFSPYLGRGGRCSPFRGVLLFGRTSVSARARARTTAAAAASAVDRAMGACLFCNNTAKQKAVHARVPELDATRIEMHTIGSFRKRFVENRDFHWPRGEEEEP